MRYVVYRGNAAFEETSHGTTVRVGRRQATIPHSLLPADALRTAARELQHPRPSAGFAPSPGMRVLEKMGALATTALEHADLDGWSYVLKHAPDPDQAIERLAEWALDASSIPDDEALASGLWRMFATATEVSRVCRIVVWGEDVGTYEPGTVCLVIDPRVSSAFPARAVVTDDVQSLARQWGVHDPRRAPVDAQFAGPGSPLRRLLIALGIALLVDRTSGIGRLRNAYTVTRDLDVSNVTMKGYPEHVRLAETADERIAATNAQIVDRVLVRGASDPTVAGELRLSTHDRRAIATCIWRLRGTAQTASASGADAAEAGVNAIAAAVSRSLRILGWRSFIVRVGSAGVVHGNMRPGAARRVDPDLLGDEIEVFVDEARVQRGPESAR